MGDEKQKDGNKRPKIEYDGYSVFLHKSKVEVHVNYGNTILKLQGIIKAKARYEIQLVLDEKKNDYIVINKAHVVAIKPLD